MSTIDTAAPTLSKRAEKKENKKAAAADSRAVSLMIPTDPPSGTRDFFPEDMRLRTWLFGLMRDAATSFGFQEYDAPVLEAEELYKRKAGEEITEQMYNFVDKEGAKVTLRPEMTPTLVRMVLSRMRANAGATGPALQVADVLPLKWFSIPQCWRFETTQRGRKREHYQLNCDIIGVQGITAELELLACTVKFFESVGITPADVGIRINSRKILGAALDAAGVSKENFAKVCVIVDKIEKVSEAEVLRQLMISEQAWGPGLDAETAQKVVASVNKNFTLESNPTLDGVSELKELFAMAKEYGIADWITFDASVVRGLAYYTGIVWEAFDRKGVLRAIAGGGRYDELFTLYGAPQRVPCVGFGFGDCVIVELLKERGLLPNLAHGVDFVVATYPGCYAQGLKVAAGLRAAGANVDVALEPGKKVANVFKYADKMGARAMAFVAPSEWEQGKVRVKDLRGGQEGERKERDVSLDEFPGWRKWFD